MMKSAEKIGKPSSSFSLNTKQMQKSRFAPRSFEPTESDPETAASIGVPHLSYNLLNIPVYPPIQRYTETTDTNGRNTKISHTGKYIVKNGENDIRKRLFVKKGAKPPEPKLAFISKSTENPLEGTLMDFFGDYGVFESRINLTGTTLEIDLAKHKSEDELRDPTKESIKGLNDCGMYAGCLAMDSPRFFGTQALLDVERGFNREENAGKEAMPGVGEIYYAHPPLGVEQGKEGLNKHYATVVAVDASDRITSEANAGDENRIWAEFNMYGSKEGQSFVEQHYKEFDLKREHGQKHRPRPIIDVYKRPPQQPSTQ